MIKDLKRARYNTDGTPDKCEWWTWTEICDSCKTVIQVSEDVLATKKPDEDDRQYCIPCMKNMLESKERCTAKHFNLLKIHVITQEDLDLFIQDGECTSLDDLEVSTTNFDWDFAQRALVDVDKNEILMWNDNIHTGIDDDIDRFLDGITYVGNTYSLKEVCLLEEDMEQYEGVRYR